MSPERLLSLLGWLALVLHLTGCSIGSETPYSHQLCVLADKHKVGDERYTCTVDARFRSAEACKVWEDYEKKDDPKPYEDGRLKSKCDKD